MGLATFLSPSYLLFSHILRPSLGSGAQESAFYKPSGEHSKEWAAEPWVVRVTWVHSLCVLRGGR